MAEEKKPTVSSLGDKWYRQPAVLLRIALALTFFVYLRAIKFDFVYDDHFQIGLNPWLDSWRQVPAYFTHQLWAFTDIHTQASYYRPLFMLWLAVVKHFTGGAPGWYHLATIVLHLVVVSEAFVLARLLVRDDVTAAFAAALFALHPSKVEAVAWISGGGEALFAAFFFATFIAYLSWREGGSWAWACAALGLFALALLSKEQAVVVPVVLLAYEWRKQRGTERRVRGTLIAVAPFVAVAAVFWAVRWHVMRGLAEPASAISWDKTLLTQPLAWLWYLWHLGAPVRLSLFYPELIVRQFSVIAVVLPGIAMIAIAAVAWRFARRSAEGVLLYAWFVLTLTPPIVMVLLLQPHDRYLYSPSFPAAVGVAAAVRKLLRSEKTQLLTVAAICAVFATIASYELRFWDNDIAVMEHAVARAPENALARVTLAISYAENGQVANSETQLREALRRNPNDMDAWQALATEEYSEGQYQQAYEDFQHAVRVAPQDREGFSAYNLGVVTLKLGRPQEAEQWARKAIMLDPKSATYHRSLAAILEAQGRKEEAERERELARHLKK